MASNYTFILEKEATGGYHVFCPALRVCHSEGETTDEAKRNIKEALELYLESLIAHDEIVPVERIEEVASIPVAV